VSQQQVTTNEPVLSKKQATQRESRSLYFHVPFCRFRCAYCDFNTYAGLDELIPAYGQALAREVRLVGAAAPAEGALVHTIFFGGGTPSLMPLAYYADIFRAIHQAFVLTDDCEITLEANPGTVDQAYLDGLRALGVNRLSFGVQSSHAWELRLLDRQHSFEDVITAVRLARAAGFTAVDSRGLNLDLIFALPHQRLADWQATLGRALALEPEHLSLYALSLENGTPLRSWVTGGLLPTPDPDLAAEMYLWASDTLAAHGFEQYEISNWAKTGTRDDGTWKLESVASDIQPPTSSFQQPSFACRHNLQYWRNLPYLGFGAGAHGSAAGWRYSNVLAPAAYIGRLSSEIVGDSRPFPFSPATVETIAVTPETARDETMMLGLRLVREGVAEADFEARYGLTLDAAYQRRLKRLMALGLLARDGERVRLTDNGRLLGNRVFREFV
jgi:oxygen-independent coproporphyrinogen-3 oxidase